MNLPSTALLCEVKKLGKKSNQEKKMRKKFSQHYSYEIEKKN
tara:strand:+ start:1726 stop:1851 length:126 start_codon:yes stop_codon:yes gene_type:complete